MLKVFLTTCQPQLNFNITNITQLGEGMESRQLCCGLCQKTNSVCFTCEVTQLSFIYLYVELCGHIVISAVTLTGMHVNLNI